MKTAILLLLAGGSLFAHPLGIFSINRYSRIELSEASARIVYVIDVAEIPSVQEFTKIDANGDKTADEGERAAYARTMMPLIMGGFRLELDGKEVSVQPSGYDLSFPEGQGGLRTIRLESTFDANNVIASVHHSLKFKDVNYEDRTGWKEIVIRAGRGIVIEQSSAPEKDLTNELRSYPADRLTNPVSISEATAKFRTEHAGGSSGSVLNGGGIVEKAKDGFAELISAKELSLPVMLVSLLIAFMLGAGHALTPGHGKTIVAAYLVGQRGTAKHAAFLGLTVTATHTIGVFAMGLIALFASRYVVPEKLFPWLGLISGLLVVGIGVTLIRSRLRTARGSNGHSHSHEHDHHHGNGDHTHHSHSHAPSGDITWKKLFALGVSGGLLPCPSAIVVLLSAIALGRIGFGLLLIVAFSLGLAGVLTGIGLVMVYGRKLFEKLKTDGPMIRWLPVVSAFVVTIAGAIISFQALNQTGIASLFAVNSDSIGDVVRAGSVSVLVLGFVLGLKHALDADHLIAVSTIVSERRGFWSSSIVGALWGLGHTASLLIVGLIVIAFNFQIPDRIAQGMEFSVALMLIILGANVLWKIKRGAKFHVHTHEHNHHLHIHPHLHTVKEPVGQEHQHRQPKTKIGKKPFFVGMVHGMAGSAALMLVVLATISSRAVALTYIAIFGFGSVGGMFLMSALIGLPFTLTSRHDRLNNIVRTSAGIISLCFGLFYAWQIGFAEHLFR